MISSLDPEKLPVINLPRTKLEIVLEILSVFGIIAMLINIVLSWPSLPEQFPQHFGASGKPDAWGGKKTLFFLPAVTILMFGV